MYSKQLSESYDHETSFNTRFNGLVIDDIQEFFESHGDEVIEIFNLSHKHTQSIGITYPMDTMQFLSEGNLVTLTEMSETEYVGVIESVDDPESYSGSMLVGPEDEFLAINLLYKYDKSDVTLPMHETVEQGDVECLYYEEPVEILIEQFNTEVLNRSIDLDILCVVSDEYIAEVVDDDQMRVALSI